MEPSLTSKKSDILYIVLPAYNEQEMIRRVVADWYGVVCRHCGGGLSRLIVINDGSRDDTLSILREMERDHPLLCVLSKTNSGHGRTVREGYDYALLEGADFIFQTDSDGQTLPEEFEDFWKRRKHADMVIGDRRHRQDGLGRLIVTKVLKAVIRLKLHVSVRDANTPYRLMSASSLREVLKRIPGDCDLTNAACAAVYARLEKKVLYLPITFRPRQGGKNSINTKRINRMGWQALKDFGEIEKQLLSK